jgi:hypothetical protein
MRGKKISRAFIHTNKEAPISIRYTKKAETKQSGMGLLLCSATLVSKSSRVVDSKRKTGSNAAEATAKADGKISEEETSVLVIERLTKLSLF